MFQLIRDVVSVTDYITGKFCQLLCMTFMEN